MMIDETNKGKRVELVFTSDEYTRLKPGSQGTYLHCNKLPDGKHQHCIQWDDGSSLMLIEGVDQFKFINSVREIRMLPDEEKYKIYEELEQKYHGKITSKEHPSGFPAITVSVEGKPKFITDCLSVETWWRKREGLTHFLIFPPEGSGHGFGTSVKTKEEAIEKAAEYFKVKASEIDESKGWKIENRGVNP